MIFRGFKDSFNASRINSVIRSKAFFRLRKSAGVESAISLSFTPTVHSKREVLRSIGSIRVKFPTTVSRIKTTISNAFSESIETPILDKAYETYIQP
jgi:hypothetical protein